MSEVRVRTRFPILLSSCKVFTVTWEWMKAQTHRRMGTGFPGGPDLKLPCSTNFCPAISTNVRYL